MPTLFWDIETRSTVALEDAGAWRYAADPTSEVLCVGYAVDDSDVQIWTPGQAIPQEFIAVGSDPSWCVVAHNFAFERAIATRCARFLHRYRPSQSCMQGRAHRT